LSFVAGVLQPTAEPEICFKWETASRSSQDSDTIYNDGYFGYTIYDTDDKILHEEPVSFAALNTSGKSCVNRDISKIVVETNNANGWHGSFFVHDKNGAEMQIKCGNCINDVQNTNNIFVDTDDNRYKDWFSKVMACQRSCDLLVLKNNWGQWSSYSECDQSCGEGKKVRRRVCGDIDCSGADLETISCRIQECPNETCIRIENEEWSKPIELKEQDPNCAGELKLLNDIHKLILDIAEYLFTRDKYERQFCKNSARYSGNVDSGLHSCPPPLTWSQLQFLRGLSNDYINLQKFIKSDKMQLISVHVNRIVTNLLGSRGIYDGEHYEEFRESIPLRDDYEKDDEDYKNYDDYENYENYENFEDHEDEADYEKDDHFEHSELTASFEVKPDSDFSSIPVNRNKEKVTKTTRKKRDEERKFVYCHSGGCGGGGSLEEASTDMFYTQEDCRKKCEKHNKENNTKCVGFRTTSKSDTEFKFCRLFTDGCKANFNGFDHLAYYRMPYESCPGWIRTMPKKLRELNCKQNLLWAKLFIENHNYDEKTCETKCERLKPDDLKTHYCKCPGRKFNCDTRKMENGLYATGCDLACARGCMEIRDTWLFSKDAPPDSPYCTR